MATGRIELGPTGKTVAANVKRLRDAHGWSLRALAKRMEEAGRRLSADALNKIENGRLVDSPEHEGKPLHIRRVDSDDLVALAVALEVSPSALLLPLDDDPMHTLEVTGTRDIPADVAWDWMDGQRPLRLNPGQESTDRLEYDLYSRPPRRRTVEKVAGWDLISDPRVGRLIKQLMREDREAANGGDDG